MNWDICGAGLILGLQPKSMHIRPLGIAIIFEDYTYGKLKEWKKFVIALAGPMTNILIIVLIALLNLSTDIGTRLTYINVIIAVFNLIPIYPLDGGRILHSLFNILKSNKNTDKVCNTISNIAVIALTILCSFVIIYMKNIAILFIIGYLWVIVVNENRRYNLKLKIKNIVDDRDLAITVTGDGEN